MCKCVRERGKEGGRTKQGRESARAPEREREVCVGGERTEYKKRECVYVSYRVIVRAREREREREREKERVTSSEK